MIVLAVTYLALFATQVLWLSAPPIASRIMDAAQVALWLVFVADFAIRIWLAPKRLHYIVTHPIDIITILLPAFRAFRALRVFAALRVLVERGRRVEFGQVWIGLVAAVLFLAVLGSLVVLDAERDAPNALIKTFPGALWWSFVTLTTVGYGDKYPVTAVGEISAVFIMIAGIGLLGTVTATLAAWFAAKLQTRTDDEIEEVLDEVRALRRDLASLRDDLAATRSYGEEPEGLTGPGG